MNENLSLRSAATEDLVRELADRSEACIVAYERRQGEKDHSEWYYFGGISACIGLAVRLTNRMVHTYDTDETEVNG